MINRVAMEPITHYEAGAFSHYRGAIVWHSHMDAAIHQEHRFNQSHPAEDHRRGPSPVAVLVTPSHGGCEVRRGGMLR